VERTTIAGGTEELGENLPQRHFVPPQIPHDQVRFRTPDRSGGKPATNRLSYGAAWETGYEESNSGLIEITSQHLSPRMQSLSAASILTCLVTDYFKIQNTALCFCSCCTLKFGCTDFVCVWHSFFGL
jgi:hypothetical protein